MSSVNSYFYAAIVTIVVVHVLLAVFIYTALSTDSGSKPAVHKID